MARSFEYLNATIYESLKNENTKTAARVLAWLDKDYLLITKYSDGKSYYFECHAEPMPKYVYKFLRAYIPKKTGLEYVFENIPL